jgi:hypothetical protein
MGKCANSLLTRGIQGPLAGGMVARIMRSWPHTLQIVSASGAERGIGARNRNSVTIAAAAGSVFALSLGLRRARRS